MAIDFAHSLCYYENGTHKAFGVTAKSDLQDITDFFCAQVNDVTHYFPCFSTVQTGDIYKATNKRVYKNSTLIVHSVVGQLTLAYQVTNSSWMLSASKVPAKSYLQDIQITGTIVSGSGSTAFSETFPASDILFIRTGTSSGNVTFNLTFNIVGTSYSKSISTTVGSGTTRETIVLTESVNP